MIYIVRRWCDEDDCDIVLVTTNKKMAYSAMEKLCNIYPDDYINVSEWGNGQISNYYESDLEGVLEDIIDD